MTQDVYHIPALLPESLEALCLQPSGVYVDATLGGGGHSRAIVEHLGEDGHLYSLDRDSDAIARAFADSRFTAVHGDFRYMANYLRYYGHYGDVDGILADLGVSSHHFDDADRGFSFRADAPLDMRMNRASSLTAAALLAEAPEERLATIFRIYGEFRQARRLASAIVKRRDTDPVLTTGQLASLAEPMLNPARAKKELAQVFQALRIEVNGEMEALEAFLRQSVELLRPGGRLAVITYHSLEDRMVKNFMRSGRIDGEAEKDLFGRSDAPLKPLGKAVGPTPEEVERNPRSRSAKLRVAVKNEELGMRN